MPSFLPSFLRKKKKSEAESAAEKQQQDEAAIKIQARVRGAKARKRGYVGQILDGAKIVLDQAAATATAATATAGMHQGT